MDGNNGPPMDSRLITAPTVAPPPGIRPMSQPMFASAVGASLGLPGLQGLRPAPFNPAAAGGLPLFQAQPPPAPPPSTTGRKATMDRAKSGGQGAGGRKQCNCKNSRCLKLYCECFASGRYCENCNCLQCFNNRENEATRQSAVEAILERNPNAFRPKIQSHEQSAAATAAVVNNAAPPPRHLKGCNCKKSFCLKKYCECFQAGIYCSDNCKCVDCKNFEDTPYSGPGSQAGTGAAKRVRYSSAPSAPAGLGGPLGLPPSGMGLPAGVLPTIRPGLLSAGLSGIFQQQQQQPGVGSGLPPGLPGAAPMAGGPPGGPTGGLGGVRPLGAAGMAGLPPGMATGLGGPGGLAGLSLALAAAAGAAPAGGAQAVLSGLCAAAQQQQPQPGQPLALPPPLARSGLHEVVNGMVKRHVIEELCRLLWLVADDEGGPARTAPAAAAGSGGAASAPRLANGGSGGPQQQAAANSVGGDGGEQGKQEEQGRSGGAEGAGAQAGPAGCGSEAGAGGMEGQAGAGGGEVMTCQDDGDPSGVLAGREGGMASGQPTGAAEAGAERGGHEPGPAAAGPGPQQQPPPRPGPLYGRKERVVLEEFLSIMNKIGDTAAKKLQQQGAFPLAPHLQIQQQMLPQQPPGCAPGQRPQQQQLHQLQAGLLPGQLLMAAPTHGSGAQQGIMADGAFAPQPSTSLSGPGAPLGQLGGTAAGSGSGPGTSYGLVRSPGHHGPANGQVAYSASLPMGGSGGAGAGSLPQPQAPHYSAGTAAPQGTGGVPTIRPPLPSGMAAAAGLTAGPQPPAPAPAAPPPQLPLLPPSQQHSLHGGVPVILAPPRAMQPAQQQQSQQPPPAPQQGLTMYDDHQQQHPVSLYPAQFLAYTAGPQGPVLHSDPAMLGAAASLHAPLPPPPPQQQQPEHSQLLLQQLMQQQGPHPQQQQQQQGALGLAAMGPDALLQQHLFPPPEQQQDQLQGAVGGGAPPLQSLQSHGAGDSLNGAVAAGAELLASGGAAAVGAAARDGAPPSESGMEG